MLHRLRQLRTHVRHGLLALVAISLLGVTVVPCQMAMAAPAEQVAQTGHAEHHCCPEQHKGKAEHTDSCFTHDCVSIKVRDFKASDRLLAGAIAIDKAPPAQVLSVVPVAITVDYAFAAPPPRRIFDLPPLQKNGVLRI